MPTAAYIYPATWVAGVVFAAGGVLAGIRIGQAQARKDINAIGRLVRRDRWNTMLDRMVETESREERRRMADNWREQ